MKLSEQIIRFRKQRGLSQEELAEKIGVSRQAVSKWESAQSIPDLDKLIRLSEYFDVTIDELVKGEPPNASSRQRLDARLFAGISAGINGVGLLTACLTWMRLQNELCVLAGVVIMAIGCIFYALGEALSYEPTRRAGRLKFWRINVWILSFMPLSLLVQFMTNGAYMLWSPYPLLYSGYQAMEFISFWFLYIVGCGSAEYGMAQKKHENS